MFVAPHITYTDIMFLKLLTATNLISKYLKISLKENMDKLNEIREVIECLKY